MYGVLLTGDRVLSGLFALLTAAAVFFFDRIMLSSGSPLWSYAAYAYRVSGLAETNFDFNQSTACLAFPSMLSMSFRGSLPKCNSKGDLPNFV